MDLTGMDAITSLLAVTDDLAAKSRELSGNETYVLIGLGVVGIIYLMFIRPMFRKKHDPLDAPTGGKGIGRLSQQRAVERQMQTLLVELAEMSRQVSAQLDTRVAKLELLIREADEKIAELDSKRVTLSPRVPSEFIDVDAGASVPSHGLIAPATPQPATTTTTTPMLGRRASASSVAESASEAPESRTTATHEPPDPRHVEVYALADQGRDPYEIAAQLGRPRGEIELILALRGS